MNGLIKKLIVILWFLNLFFSVSGCNLSYAKKSNTVSSPRNVIIMISDGCGYNHIKAADYFLGERAQRYEVFPVRYAMSTYEYNQSYDISSAWTDFNYVKSSCTDSASAATAMSTGIKTVNGNIGYNYNNTEALKHTSEYAEKAGYATGVVTSVEISHATPAGFTAHNVSRNNFQEIAQEMISSSLTDVIFGTGNPLYDNDGILKTTGQDYQYVGGNDTWNALVAGTAGGNVDANHDGVIDSRDCWKLIQSKAEFENFAENAVPDVSRLIGVPQIYTTLQQARRKTSTSVFGDPFNTTVPSLSVMSKAALNVLNRNKKGFFIMIEGGAMDWASHANQSNRCIEEEIQFNHAVDAVIEWVETSSSWDETLLIVTGDHESGYLLGPGSILNGTWNGLTDNGTGALPGMEWGSTGHTNSLIPFFAKGCGSDLFRYEIAGTDPVRGEYIDNTSIGKILSGFYK